MTTPPETVTLPAETVTAPAETVTQPAETVTLPAATITVKAKATSETKASKSKKKEDSSKPLGLLGGTNADAYYKNCTAARNAGAAPLYRGDPGYRSALDGDKDGVACE